MGSDVLGNWVETNKFLVVVQQSISVNAPVWGHDKGNVAVAAIKK